MPTIAIALALASQQGWTPPYETLPVPPHAASLASRLKGKDTVVWQEGEVLTFLRRDPAKEVRIIGVGGLLSPIEGTDLKILRLRLRGGWDRAVLSYSFFSVDPNQAVTYAPLPEIWRGRRAPKLPVSAKRLAGTLREYTLRSEALSEERKLTVYLPPRAPRSGLRAFFMADGEGCETYAKLLEPLILAGKVRPAAIIGVHNGGYRGNPQERMDPAKNFRIKEYIPGADRERYEAHMRFFSEEVTAWASRELGVSTRREDRCTFGYSNGGSFATAAALRHSGIFGHAIPLSPTPPPRDEQPKSPLPKLHFVVGTLESPLVPVTEFVRQLQSQRVPATLETYVSGHDSVMWGIGFARYAPAVFPRR